MSAYQAEYHSGLEVVPSHAPEVVIPKPVNDPAQAPQVVPVDVKSAESYVADAPAYPDDQKHDDGKLAPTDAEAASSVTKGGGKILGMRRTTFWLVLLVVILVIGGAIGGGVGATLSKKSNNESRCVSKYWF